MTNYIMFNVPRLQLNEIWIVMKITGERESGEIRNMDRLKNQLEIINVFLTTLWDALL